MANINQLPYFQLNPARDLSLSGVNNIKETNVKARFLLKKIKNPLKEKCPYHYLIFTRPDKKLKYIQKLSKKYKYFLKLDIEKYYPSINHKILLYILEQEIFKNNPSRRLKYIIKKELPLFLRQTPINNYGLPLGNYLSWVLSCLYLLPLDLKIPRPFLRIQDDYLIFCKHKKEPQKILKQIIGPELEKLELRINIGKLNSGQFHQNAVEFLGFRYYAGVFTICEKKIQKFKNRIIKITHLTKKKPYKAVIKLLNNKILGFGHYYKSVSSKQDFEKLDAFVRQRLRRYLIKNKDQRQKIGNLLLTNLQLENFGLKSLVSIKTKYAQENRYILRKTSKKRGKIGKEEKMDFFKKPAFWTENYEQKAVLRQLQELTKNVNQIKNKLDKIEKKLKS